MSERVLEFTTRLTREDVAGVIEALVEGLKDGHLKIHKSDEALELEVPRVIDLEVEAKVSEERAKFEIEVSWRTNRAENPDRPENDSPENTAGGSGNGTAFAEKAAPESAAQISRKSAALKKVKSTVKKTAAGSAAKKSAKPVVKDTARKTKKATAKTSGKTTGTADPAP